MPTRDSRGGVTQNIPAEAAQDEGWGNDPREWSKTLRRVIEKRRSMCSVGSGAEFGYRKASQLTWCHGPGADLTKELDYALFVGKKSLVEPKAMRYRILTYIQQAEQSAGQMRGQMVVGDFTRQGDLLAMVSQAENPDWQNLSRLLFVNRVAIQSSYLLHIKRQHAPGGIKAGRGAVPPEVVLSSVEAANAGKWADDVRRGPNGNPLVSTLLTVDGVLYRFVWEVKMGRRSLTSFNLNPVRRA
jgi:hypothetical protein